MKICISANSSPWAQIRGGGNLAAHHHATQLVELGHEVVVLYSKRPEDQLDPKVNYRIQWVHHYSVATLNLNLFSYARALRRLLRRERFDVVHGNSEESYLFPALARQYGIPFVYTSHGNIIPQQGILKGILLRPISFLKQINCYLQRQTALAADRVIAFSEFSKGLLTQGLGLKIDRKLTVVPPGIEPSWFKVKREPGPQPNLLFWGRLEDQKGVRELISALALVINKIPAVQLTFIGEGQLESHLRNQVEDLGLRESVEFAGWQEVAVIQEAAARFRLGVFPSRIESFGLAISEAAATGLPLISTQVGAIPEYIESGRNGTLVPPENVPALADAIIKALNDPERVEIQAERAREELHVRFSWKKAAEKIVELYQFEIDSKPSSPLK